ncbi:two-component system sensor histidine kinase [Bifidobacterium sp. DSM 109958]|uniref:histidine kinase n=1 Tax=Bifidobacterium moraviense TaxID=2675323 RepID=A0A7Y0F396_9BIFI|nr:HAMP domain-containing sensor histidine kinase [Bifidobacterium sp. DSM 109958]NMN01136.1 two-component system sensor histidine kinase [Bifidobacterium sp. DSM 109958]
MGKDEGNGRSGVDGGHDGCGAKRRMRVRAQGVAGTISLRMTVAMAAVTMVGGVLFACGVLLGSRHEFAERGLDPDSMSVTAQFGAGMIVIDLEKAIIFTLLSIICVVAAVAVIGWYYSRREVAPLERALELQRDFVADASHELKTPLAVIATRLDLIDFRRAQGRPIDDALADLHGDVDRMNAIITDLLTAARGAVNAEPVRLADVMEQSFAAVRPLADAHRVTLRPRIDGAADEYVVRGNLVGLSRCLVAVLDNAVAHAPEGTDVTVRLGHLHPGRLLHGANEAALRVSDHGAGIGGDPERLFRRFARDDDGTAHQGYGLGLALARDVAGRYGGTIDVESSSPQGTTMLITLPLDDAAGNISGV